MISLRWAQWFRRPHRERETLGSIPAFGVGFLLGRVIGVGFLLGRVIGVGFLLGRVTPVT